MRHIDPIALKNVSDYIDKRITDLDEYVKILLKDIEKITDFYQGEDAIILQKKYIDRVENLQKIYSINMENLSYYFKTVSNAHTENLENSKKNISKVAETSATKSRVVL